MSAVVGRLNGGAVHDPEFSYLIKIEARILSDMAFLLSIPMVREPKVQCSKPRARRSGGWTCFVVVFRP